MQHKRKLKTAGLFLLIAGALTLLAGVGTLRRADLAAADALYQSPSAQDGDIILVGIDQRALEELGPYSQWGRDVMARALDALNRSEDCRPAVIGLDVLYAGESQPEADALLAEAAGRYGNVVAASLAQIGSAMVESGDGEYYMDRSAVTAYDRPYDALDRVTEQGHINAMLDGDGILRHHMLTLTLPDGTQVPSMALAVADRWRAAHGEPPVERPATSSRGFWYLPFCGKPGDFDQSISIVDLLSGAVPAEDFAGRIVLIGPYAAGLQDSYLTAMDHARLMYGVEYQANAIQALLWGEYKTELADAPQLAALFLVLLLSLWGFWRRRVKWSTALWLLLCVGWVLACRGLYEAGWVLHVLWVPVGVTILYGGCLAANYIRAVRERQRVTRIFEHHVAPEIVRELLKEDIDDLHLEGNTVRIAVLFVDIREFTKMSEKLRGDATRLVDILNGYLTFIHGCAMRNGGTVDKFVGDAVMAFWGAPLPQEDYVMRAARAAREMVDGMPELSRRLKEKYGYGVSYGVGIHLGEAVVGNTGCESRKNYTAIGDTVNTAARLEAAADGGIVLISRAVADALEGRIRATSKGLMSFKNKEDMEVLTMDGIIEFTTGEDAHE